MSWITCDVGTAAEEEELHVGAAGEDAAETEIVQEGAVGQVEVDEVEAPSETVGSGGPTTSGVEGRHLTAACNREEETLRK